MPQGKHEIELELAIATVWDFVRVLDNWVVLVPGYISHEVINERQVLWTFTGDIGIMKKEITLRIDITKWIEPTEVGFTLTGISSKFVGEGYFKAQPVGEKRTKMAGFLDITAQGIKAPMVNSILKTHVPQLTTDLVEAIAKNMYERDASATKRR